MAHASASKKQVGAASPIQLVVIQLTLSFSSPASLLQRVSLGDDESLQVDLSIKPSSSPEAQSSTSTAAGLPGGGGIVALHAFSVDEFNKFFYEHVGETADEFRYKRPMTAFKIGVMMRYLMAIETAKAKLDIATANALSSQFSFLTSKDGAGELADCCILNHSDNYCAAYLEVRFQVSLAIMMGSVLGSLQSSVGLAPTAALAAAATSFSDLAAAQELRENAWDLLLRDMLFIDVFTAAEILTHLRKQIWFFPGVGSKEVALKLAGIPGAAQAARSILAGKREGMKRDIFGLLFGRKVNYSNYYKTQACCFLSFRPRAPQGKYSKIFSRQRRV